MNAYMYIHTHMTRKVFCVFGNEEMFEGATIVLIHFYFVFQLSIKI